MSSSVDRPRVAIIAAMKSEMRPVVKQLALRETTVGGSRAFQGAAAGVELVAITTDMGTAAATSATGALLDAHPVDHVIVVGIAGGVDPQLDIGELVVPHTVVHRDVDVETRPVPLAGSTAEGKIVTSDELHYVPELVAQMVADGVTAVDMETGAIGHVCEQRDVTWSAFRAISDRVDGDAVDYAVFDLANPDGSPNSGAAARYLLTHPWKVPYLARLAKGSNKAIATSTAAVVHAVDAHDFG